MGKIAVLEFELKASLSHFLKQHGFRTCSKEAQDWSLFSYVTHAFTEIS